MVIRQSRGAPSSSTVDAALTYGRFYQPEAYGAVGDLRVLFDVAVTSGSATISSASAAFSVADIGKTVIVSKAVATASGVTLTSTQSAGVNTITGVSGALPNGPYILGSGGTAEEIHNIFSNGSTSTILGRSTTNQVLANGHSSGEAFTSLGLLVATISSVTSSTQAVISVTPSVTLAGLTGWVGTDDTAAWRAMATALPAGARVDVKSKYLITGAVTFPRQVKLTGRGGLFDTLDAPSLVVSSSLTADALVFSAPGCVLEDFALVNANLYSSYSGQTSGAGIRMTNGAFCNIWRMSIVGFYNNIQVDQGFYYTIKGCFIYDPVQNGVFLTDPVGNMEDHGDQQIEGCIISPTFVPWREPADSAVRWEAGGGLRFIGNKVNGCAQPGPSGNSLISCGKFHYGVRLLVADGVDTSVLMVMGNSIENVSTRSISVEKKGPSYTGTFSKIVVTGNEIGLSGNPGVALYVDGHSSAVPIAQVTFTSNNIYNLPAIETLYCKQVICTDNMVREPVLTVFKFNTGTQEFICRDNLVDKDNVQILQDSTYSPTVVTSQSMAKADYEREIPSTTSTSTYTTLWRVQTQATSAGVLDLTLAGQVAGVGPFMVQAKRAVRNTGGTTTSITTPAGWADLTAGTAVDIAFDDTTTAGWVYVKVRLNSVAGGTAIFGGLACLTVTGPIAFLVKKGA